MGNTAVIVFGRFLLDRLPIKFNKSSGVGGKKLLEMMKGDGGAGYKERKCKGKGKERKRMLHYRDQLLGAVSYGICCFKCHVALLHWDSVWGETGDY